MLDGCLFDLLYNISIPGDKDGRCVGLTTLPPSCADCPEILEPLPPGTPRACSGKALSLLIIFQNYRGLFTKSNRSGEIIRHRSPQEAVLIGEQLPTFGRSFLPPRPEHLQHKTVLTLNRYFRKRQRTPPNRRYFLWQLTSRHIAEDSELY
jgi:hypothetical protein